MKTEKFNEIVEEQISACVKTLAGKGDEYATEDRLHNFKAAAAIEGVTPIQALAGQMAKHTVSEYDLCRDDDTGLMHPKALWAEKITDHINYLLLLRALVEEGETE